MPFVTLQGEQHLADLIKAHYGLLDPAEAERAEKLLLEANPELKNLHALPPGAVIRIPSLIGRTPARTENDPAAPVNDLLLDQLERFAGVLSSDIANETTALKEDEGALDGDAVLRALDQLPELRPVAEAAKQGMKQREQNLQQAQEFETMLPAIRAALGKLLGAYTKLA